MTPEQVDKLIDFGQMALEQGWYDQARDYFEQALAFDASNPEAVKRLATANEMLDRLEVAAVEPIQAEPVEPPHREEVETLLRAGQVDLKAGYPEHARQYLERALALDPSNMEAKEAIAKIDSMAGRSKRSVSARTRTHPVVPAARVGYIKVRESRMRLGFWLKVICTLGLYLLVWESRYLELTGQRLIHHSGVFTKRERTVRLDKVLDISIKQGFLGQTLY